MADHRDLTAAALAAARRAGCTCSPVVEVSEVARGVFSAAVGHDECCPVLARVTAPHN